MEFFNIPAADREFFCNEEDLFLKRRVTNARKKTIRET